MWQNESKSGNLKINSQQNILISFCLHHFCTFKLKYVLGDFCKKALDRFTECNPFQTN